MSKVDGQCPCHVNYGGRQCNQCNPGYYQYPTCFGKHNHECIENLYEAPLINFKICLKNFVQKYSILCKKKFCTKGCLPTIKDCACDRTGSVGRSCSESGVTLTFEHWHQNIVNIINIMNIINIARVTEWGNSHI